MVVCKFFQQGNCRFGDGCKFEHPGSSRGFNSNSNSNTNRFAPLSVQGQGQNQQRGRSGAVGGGATQSEPFNVTNANIKQDLSSISGGDPPGDRPIWPLSCYAPGNKPPRQLIEGDLEQSPEEMRVKYYIAKAAGREQEYANHERDLLNQVEQKVQAILNDVEGAKKYVVDGQYEHPNRLDLETKPTQPWNKPTGGFGQPAAQTSAFGAPSAPATSGGFGQTSSLGGGNAFGQPSRSGFGQTSQLGASSTASAGGFGQPSALGGGGGFGQTSNMGQRPSAFGAPAQPGFGQSGFGAAAKPSPFAAPAQTAQAAPAFGSSTAFGAATKKPSPFGSPQPAQSSSTAFGQPSAFGAASRPSPFAAASQQPSTGFIGAAANPSPFGQKPAFGQSGLGSSSGTFGTGFGQRGVPAGFGAPSQPTSGFGAASQPATTGGFGAPSQTAAPAFGAPTQPAASGFGAPSQPGAANTGFGAPAQPVTSGFGAPVQPAAPTGGFGSTTQPAAAPNTAQPELPLPSHWHGMQVIPDEQDPKIGYYMKHAPTQIDPNHHKKERIWFPHARYGKEVPDAEPPKEILDSDLGRQLKELYDFVTTNGAFKDGVVPEIPPKREWVGWDF
ncbi:Nucleoporin AMO1 [Fulvia fulva]|nr:Nucleoporin AMO1 [Fulvia fulva]WPV21655.1 Nucleoporin AMO1 [Fulvia fulva]